MDRRALRELFGLEFPPELFLFWDWYSALTDAHKKTFGDGGMRPGGVCDVLAGKFDGVDLTYPAVLHWRYRYELPELETIGVGKCSLPAEEIERLAAAAPHAKIDD